MQTVKLDTTPRSESGKGPARRLRSTDLIPAVVYGRDFAAQSISVSPKALVAAIGGELGRNVVFSLDLDGKSQSAQMADYQVHPVSRDLLHVDFRTVAEDKPVVVKVPFEFIGKARGTQGGAVLRKVYRELPVKCLPAAIPAKLEHDVSELDLEDTVNVSDLKLPDGLEVMLRAGQRLGGVYGSKHRPEEEGEGEEGAPAEVKAD